MPEKTIEIEAASLEEARAQAKEQIPAGWLTLSEEVLAEGGPGSVQAMADTSEEALEKANAGVPAKATAVKRKEVRAPATIDLRVEAHDQAEASKAAHAKMDKTMRLASLRVVTPGKKGVLGLGRKPHQYVAKIVKQAIVEVSWEQKARLRVKIGDRVTGWAELLAAVTSMRDAQGGSNKADPLAMPLFAEYPHQILLIPMLGMDPGRYREVPFDRVKDSTVARARKYVECTTIPGAVGAMASMVGSGLPADRYKIMASGEVARQTDLVVDGMIAQVASCLPKVHISGAEAIGRACFEAIRHYSEIPIVSYFCALPYFETIIKTKKMSAQELKVTVYKGTEAMLLEIWDELGEGEVITDERVSRKAKAAFAG